MNCEFCQSPVHVWFQCPKKPDGWRPARLAKQKPRLVDEMGSSHATGSIPVGAVKSTGSVSGRSPDEGQQVLPRSTVHLPVDTNSEPQLIPASNPQRLGSVTGNDTGVVALKPAKFDKKAWMREYMREHRRGIRRRKPSGS